MSDEDHYKWTFGTHPNELAERVNEEIREGWKPLGAPIEWSLAHPGPESERRDAPWLYQFLTRGV